MGLIILFTVTSDLRLRANGAIDQRSHVNSRPFCPTSNLAHLWPISTRGGDDGHVLNSSRILAAEQPPRLLLFCQPTPPSA